MKLTIPDLSHHTDPGAESAPGEVYFSPYCPSGGNSWYYLMPWWGAGVDARIGPFHSEAEASENLRTKVLSWPIAGAKGSKEQVG